MVVPERPRPPTATPLPRLFGAVGLVLRTDGLLNPF